VVNKSLIVRNCLVESIPIGKGYYDLLPKPSVKFQNPSQLLARQSEMRRELQLTSQSMSKSAKGWLSV
jgi:hypothetical protein